MGTGRQGAWSLMLARAKVVGALLMQHVLTAMHLYDAAQDLCTGLRFVHSNAICACPAFQAFAAKGKQGSHVAAAGGTQYSPSLLKGKYSVDDCFEFAFCHQPSYDFQLIAVGLHSCRSILRTPP